MRDHLGLVKSGTVTHLGSFPAPSHAPIDAPEAAQSFAELAADALSAPVGVVSLPVAGSSADSILLHVTDEDVPSPVKDLTQAFNFCRHVALRGDILATEDLPQGAPSADILYTGGVAYLGAPIRDPEGRTIGALCVADQPDRIWTAAERKSLGRVAACLSRYDGLKTKLNDARNLQLKMGEAYRRLSRYSGIRDEIGTAFFAPNRPIQARIDDLLRAVCRIMGFDRATLARINCGDAQIVAQCPMDGWQDRVAVTLSDKLAGIVASGNAILQWEDTARAAIRRNADLFGDAPGAYVGIPIVRTGALFGILELTNKHPRRDRWAEADAAIFALVGLMISANIEALSQSERIRDSEIELMAMLRDRSRLES